MKIHIITVSLIFSLCGCVSATRPPSSGRPTLAFGVYEKGHNITEPKPQKSEYLETKTGGVVVLSAGAGLFLETRVIKHPANELYITVEYENPLGGISLTNDMPFKPEAEELHFSVPAFQPGLRCYAD